MEIVEQTYATIPCLSSSVPSCISFEKKKFEYPCDTDKAGVV